MSGERGEAPQTPMTEELPFPGLRRVGHLATTALETALRAMGPRPYRFVVRELQKGVHREGFEIAGIRYFPEPCSVGLTPQGELTGRSAADLIRERGLSNLRVLDICCGVGIVGLTMLAVFRETETIQHMSFADINIFNINSVKRTLANNAEVLRTATTSAFLSDNLRGIPPGSRYDLIVSNPPHFSSNSFTEAPLDPIALGNADPAWSFHQEFYRSVHEYLAPGGESWLFENGNASSPDTFEPLISKNAELEYVESFPDKRDSTFFWQISRRRS